MNSHLYKERKGGPPGEIRTVLHEKLRVRKWPLQQLRSVSTPKDLLVFRIPRAALNHINLLSNVSASIE